MQKVLFAIGNPAFERGIAKILNETPDEYRIIGTLTNKPSIIEFLTNREPDILVYRENFDNDKTPDSDFDFIINEIKCKYPRIRIVFIAGPDREPGDKKIPLLITWTIYDIVAGQTINIKEVVDFIKTPRTLVESRKWLPNRRGDDGLFDDDELNKLKNDQSVHTGDNDETTIEVEELPKQPPQGKKFGLSLKDRLFGSGPKEPKQQKKKDKTSEFNENKEVSVSVEQLPKTEEPEEKIIPQNTESASAEPESEPVRESGLTPDEVEITVENIPQPQPEPEPEPEPAPPPAPEIKKTAPKVDKGHVASPLIPKSLSLGERKAPSRANADQDEELMKAKKRIAELERKTEKLEAANKQQEKDLEQSFKDYLNLEKQASSNSKQRVVMFHGSMAGVGNSTLALNVANYLALKRFKVIYIEFDNINPTLSYWYDLGGLNAGIEKAMQGIETRAYQDIGSNIITKDMILGLNSDMKDKHEKYPDLLSYMVFTEDFVKRSDTLKMSSSTMKDLLMLLLYKNGYDYIILDMHANIDYQLLETASIFSTTNVFTMTQDVVSIGTAMRKFGMLEPSGLDFEMLCESKENKRNSMEKTQNFKNFYVINKFKDDCIFGKKRITEWLETSDNVFFVPENTSEIYNAIYKALPVILTSKNKNYVMQIKRIAEAI